MPFLLPDTFVNEQNLKVAVIGAGGTGSHIVGKLAMLKRLLDAINNEERTLCNIEQIHVYDSKQVNQFALARGLFTIGEVGANKATALATRYNNMLNSETFRAYETNFKASDIPRYDVIITSVDQAKIRVEIGNQPIRKDALWLDCGVNKNEFSVILGELGQKSDKLPNVLDLTDLESVDDSINKEPSCSVMTSIDRQIPFINDTNASFAISLLSQLFLQGQIEVSGCITDLNTLRSTPIEICETTYLQFGYEHFKTNTESLRH